MTESPKVGDVQTDIDGSEWVVISVFGRNRTSRVKRNSLAHYIHAEVSPIIAESFEREKVEQ